MAKDYFKLGTYNVTCAVCAGVFKADELKERWDGVKVCSKDWEPRNILDFFRPVPDKSQTVPWSQPNDSEGEIHLTNLIASVPTYITSIATDLKTDVNYRFFYGNASFATAVVLPEASNSSFMGTSFIYTLINDATSTPARNIVIDTEAGSIAGGARALAAGHWMKFQNIPESNVWLVVANG